MSRRRHLPELLRLQPTQLLRLHWAAKRQRWWENLFLVAPCQALIVWAITAFNPQKGR